MFKREANLKVWAAVRSVFHRAGLQPKTHSLRRDADMAAPARSANQPAARLFPSGNSGSGAHRWNETAAARKMPPSLPRKESAKRESRARLRAWCAPPPRRNARKNDAGQFALARAQSAAVRQRDWLASARSSRRREFQRIGGKRRAVVVISTTSSACRAGRLRSRRDFHDPVITDMPLGEKAPGQMHIFGGNPHPLAATRRKAAATSSRSPWFSHRSRRGHGNHHMRMAKRAAPGVRPLLPVGDRFANEILAGDAEMHMTGRNCVTISAAERRRSRQCPCRRESAIIASAAALRDVEPARAKNAAAFSAASFRGDGEHERGSLAGQAHGSPPFWLKRSIQIAAPMAEWASLHERLRKLIVAAAANGGLPARPCS